MKLKNIALLSILVVSILLTSCKKAATPKEVVTGNILEQYFDQNILNKDFTVYYAKDSGNVITGQYTGWVFRLLKNTYYDGAMTAVINGVTYTGTWSSNADYGKLIINITLPAPPAEMIFINREWRFTEKALPIMKLAPWGSTDDTELHMERQ